MSCQKFKHRRLIQKAGGGIQGLCRGTGEENWWPRKENKARVKDCIHENEYKDTFANAATPHEVSPRKQGVQAS